MNLQEEIKKLDQKRDEEVAKLKKEHETLQVLADKLGADVLEAYHRPWIHVHKLYGSVGSVDFSGCDYDSIRKGKNPDASLLGLMLAAFPPVPMVKVKDGCVSFRPDLTDENGGSLWKGDQYECFGVTVKVETYQRQAAEVHWYGYLREGELFRFEVRFPWYQTDFGTLDMVANRSGGHGDVTSWERCDVRTKHDAQRIKWASGSKEVPNSFTLYWDKDSGSKLDFPKLVTKREDWKA